MRRCIGLVCMAVLLLLIPGCKSKDENVEHAIYSSRDYAIIENLFSDAFKIMDDVANTTDGIRGFSCIEEVVVDTSASPMTLLIDFGDADCEDEDGRVREGKLLCTFTGRYHDPGTVITIDPDNFKVDGFRLEGTKTITNLGDNALANLHFSVEIVNGDVSHSASNYHVQWESSTIREWTEGDLSWFLIDDVYEITGEGQGVNRNGIAFAVEILDPLQVEFICPWITAGEVIIRSSGRDGPSIKFWFGRMQ